MSSYILRQKVNFEISFRDPKTCVFEISFRDPKTCVFEISFRDPKTCVFENSEGDPKPKVLKTMFEIILPEPKIGYKKCTFEDGSSGIVQILISKGSSVYFTGPNERLVFSLTNPDSFKVLKILNDTISIPFPGSIVSKNGKISPIKISSFPGDDKKAVVFWRPEIAAFFFL